MKVIQAYLAAVVRVWVTLMLILLLAYAASALANLLGGSVWSWFAAIAILAAAIGVVDEWLKRRGVW